MFRTILIATDGMESGDAAVAYARDLALEQRSRLRLVHIDELIPARGGVHHLQPLEPEIRAKIRGQVSDLQGDGLEADFEVRQIVAKSPAHAIAGAATAVDADLIVLGEMDEGMVRGVFRGGLARRLMQLARCAVLVVPRRREPVRSNRVQLRVVDSTAEA
jgi:nucleotide-binding universal stress UspA family protein